MYQLLSESAEFHRRCDKNISAYFFLGHGVDISSITATVGVDRISAAGFHVQISGAKATKRPLMLIMDKFAVMCLNCGCIYNTVIVEFFLLL